MSAFEKEARERTKVRRVVVGSCIVWMWCGLLWVCEAAFFQRAFVRGCLLVRQSEFVFVDVCWFARVSLCS